MSRDPRDLIDDMRSACDLIVQFADGLTESGLTTDAKSVAAIERQLFILGEAAKQLPVSIRERAREIEWRQIAGFRDVLAHTYWRVDPAILWYTVRDDIPALRNQLRDLAARL